MSKPSRKSASPTEMTRAEFLKLCGGAAAAATGMNLLSPLMSTANAAEKDPVLKIGYIPITDAAPLLIAHAKGFYAKHGVNAERPVLIRGWSTISEAFTAKKFNLVHLLFPITIYMRYNRKFKMKVVAWDHLNNSAITVGGQSGIRSLKDLGGKTLAVPYWYSMHNIILQICLRQYGLQVLDAKSSKPALNQTRLLVMEPPDMPTAMANRAIDGYVVAEPFNAMGEMLAGGKILRFTGDIWKNHPCCVAVMHEDDLFKNREWSRKVVTAIVEAQQWIRIHKSEAAALLSRDGDNYLPVPNEVLHRAMNEYDWNLYGNEGGSSAIVHRDWNVSRIGFQPYPFRSATEKIVELMKQTKMEGDISFLWKLTGSTVADDLIDYELVQSAIESTGGMGQFDGTVDKGKPYSRKEIIEV